MFAHRKELAFQQACTKDQAELLEYQRYSTCFRYLLSLLAVAVTVAMVTVVMLVMLSLVLLSMLLLSYFWCCCYCPRFCCW